MFRILESKFITSAVKSDQYPPSAFQDFAFVGKSNVGKSSMINTVLNRKAIAKVSGKPGKTRLVNFFEIRFKTLETEDIGFVNFVDLPGYGFAKVSKSDRAAWKKMIMTYFEERVHLGGVFILVDIRHKADPKDIIMIDMMKESKIPFAVVATKSDKIVHSKIPLTCQKLRAGLGLIDEEIIPFSSLKKKGIEKVINWIGSKTI